MYNALTLLETPLKRCGYTSLLRSKHILRQCSRSRSVTSTVKVLLQTWWKPFAGTGALLQRV